MEVTLTALERSIDVELLRCGVTRCQLNDTPTRYPNTIIGQAVGGKISMEADCQPMSVPPRAGYVIPSNSLQRTRNLDGTYTTYHWSHMRLTLLGAVDLFQVVAIPTFLPRKTGDQIGAAVIEQVRILENSEPGSLGAIARRKELSFRILRLILEHARLRENASALLNGHARIQPALDYMQRHLSERVTRGQLARCVYLSESRFHDTFRRATGHAPLQYLQMLRLRHAQELLLSSDASVADVGQRSGFTDPFHFSRQFKAACGKSPRAYREAKVELRMSKVE